MISQKKRGILIAAAVLLCAALSLGGCAGEIANRNPTGERFPTVDGLSLEKNPTELPADLAGAPAVLLVGYAQSAQFDIDRWLMGFMQAGVKAKIVELPTIPALAPTIASKWIDDGMRAGIPREDWAAVVTLYGKAAKPVAELTGNAQPQRARVIVIDANGKIIWFADSGYSARRAMEVAEMLAKLTS